MTRRSLRPERIALLAIGILATASLAPARADHQTYPPGWNKPAPAVAPVVYQFVPGGGGVRHRVPDGTLAPAWAGAPATQSFVTGTTSSQPK